MVDQSFLLSLLMVQAHHFNPWPFLYLLVLQLSALILLMISFFGSPRMYHLLLFNLHRFYPNNKPDHLLSLQQSDVPRPRLRRYSLPRRDLGLLFFKVHSNLVCCQSQVTRDYSDPRQTTGSCHLSKNYDGYRKKYLLHFWHLIFPF